jgi:hypothetical protein
LGKPSFQLWESPLSNPGKAVFPAIRKAPFPALGKPSFQLWEGRLSSY